MNGTTRTLILALAIATPDIAAAQAQASPAVMAGKRVRVDVPGLRHCARPGRVVGTVGDSVQVEAPSPMTFSAGSPCAPKRVHTVHLRNVEVSMGVRTYAREGLLYGSLGGFLAGALRGATMSPGDPTPIRFFCLNRSETIMIFGGLGMIGGAAVGGIIGVIGRKEDWVPLIPSPASRTTLLLVPDVTQQRVGLMATIPF